MTIAADCASRMGRMAHDLSAALAADGQVLWLAMPAIALLVAVLLSPLVLWAYGRQVRRYMGFRELAPPPSAWWARRAQGVGAGVAAAAERSARTVDSGRAAQATPLAAAVMQRTRRLRRATAMAWLTLLLMAAVLVALDPTSTLPGGLGLLAFLAVMALGPALVNVQPEGGKPWLVGAGTLLVVGVMVLQHEASAQNLAIGLALVVVLYLASVHRTWRALCLPMAVGVAGLLLGAVAAAYAVIPAVCLPPTDPPQALQSTLIMLVLLACAMAFAACVWASGRVLVGLDALMRRGWCSEVSLVAGSGAAVLVGVMLLGWDDASVPVAHKLAFGLLWLGAVVAVYAAVLRRMPCPTHGRSLLMLRVFSNDRRAERLLDALQSRWRLAGPVLEIGGPDLAHLNIDLSEFIHFATGRTHELFQPGVVPAEVLAQSLQLTPDREGRFRVNEVFCFDSAWRGVVAQLLHLADGVLLDLRGFNAERQGTAFEVELLAALGLLPRVVAVGDADTDWAFFEARVAAARAGPVAPLALRVDAGAPGALQQCLDRLMAVSDAPRER